MLHTCILMCISLALCVSVQQLVTPVFDLHTFFLIIFICFCHTFYSMFFLAHLLVVTCTCRHCYRRLSPHITCLRKHTRIHKHCLVLLLLLCTLLISYTLFTFSFYRPAAAYARILCLLFGCCCYCCCFFFCIQRYQSIDVFAGYSAVDINSIIMVYFLLPL